ncbi:MAG: hypothetical protein ALECFALPRED_007614 [Alectoria fallacina]|uniref:Uncharacterized protein n=1 Tax=Alectoria fallacina TaxID=1903189 RepID=A0A8H3G7L4_9LECA|nr:MAG: hypothetical protein ALECFALPRED_007614 [Alectoria fallacina]
MDTAASDHVPSRETRSSTFSRTATSDANNAVNDASAITLVNAALDYNVRSSIFNTLRPSFNSTTLQTIVTDSDNIAEELNADNDDVRGSAELSEPSETVIA